MRKLSLALTLLTTVAMVGCRFPGGLPALNQPDQGPVEGAAVRMPAPPLSGRVTFAQRQTLAGAPDVASGATVSLINTGSNQTVSTALTNANGEFVLTFSNGYVADPTATYYLEAVKGLASNQPGNQAVRVRTVAKFSTGWTSITSATPNTGTMISPSTTALSIGAGLVNGKPEPFAFSSLVGSVSGGDTPAYAPVSGLSADDYSALLGLVQQILADAQDPVANVGLTLIDAQRVWSRLNVAPSITGFTPAQAKVGESVTAAGTGFSPIAASNVLAFNGEKAVTTSVTSNSMTSSVPQGATSGPTSLQVGALTVLGPNFSVLPVVADFSPKQGAPGTIVAVTGTGFDGKTKTNNMVEFNGVAGTITEATATQLKVRVPAGAKNGPLKLTVNGQEIATPESFKAEVTIRTVAGSLAPSSAVATEWPMDYTAAVVDAGGNLYVSSADRDAVYKISPTGTLSTVAGNGSEDFEGDGGPALKAALNGPVGLALDKAGNLYISDSNNHRIRKVNASNGVITTMAGNGSWGFEGDNGPATSAKLNYPSGLAVDTADNLYIADRNNQRIRKVDASTGVITTVAGTTGAGFGADNIPATSSNSYLYYPRGVAVDTAGNLYIADTDTHRIRKVDTSTGVITTVAGTTVSGFAGDGGPATFAKLNYPFGVAVDATGNLYIADRNNQRLRMVESGIITTKAGMPTTSLPFTGGSALSARLPMPTAVAEAANGDLFITDGVYHALFKVSNGMLSRVDTGAYTLNNPLDVEIGPDGSLYVADAKNDRILTIRDGVTTVLEFGPIEGKFLARPHDVEFDGQGNMYISDTQNDRILKRDSSGNTVVVAAGALNRPNGIAPDAAGNLYIADYNNDRIVKVSNTGVISIAAGTTNQGYNGDARPAVTAELEDPRDVAVDAVGNLYISDHYNNRIRKVDASTGVITTVAGNGLSGFRGGDAPEHVRLYYPRGISVGPSGTLYIADTDNGLIRAVGF